MTSTELAELVAVGYERRGVEFKPGGRRTDAHLFARVVRSILGMANRRDGGLVVVGVSEDQAGRLSITGVPQSDLGSWIYDDIKAGLAPYADPYVSLDVETVAVDSMSVVVITVHEFEEFPVLCRRDYQNILRDGACYVRPFRKPETSEIPTSADMRELLDLAVTKSTRRFIQRMAAAGALPAHVPAAQPNDDAQFEAQAEI